MTITTTRDDQGRTRYVLDSASPPRRPRYLNGTSAGRMAEEFARHTARRPAAVTAWNTHPDGRKVTDGAELVFRARYRDALRDVADRLRRAGAASPMRNGVREEDVCRTLDYGGRRVVIDAHGVMAFAPQRARTEEAGSGVPDTRTPRPSARSGATRARVARLLAQHHGPVRPVPARDVMRTGGVHVL